MVNNGSGGLAAGLSAMRERRDATPLLAAIRVPSLVVAGAEDRACPSEHPRMIADGIAGSRLAVIDGGGHLVNLEQPNEFNRRLLDFLRQVAPTSLNTGSAGCQC
jgi:pimeloyl-ACP methyl ester carboxylesterase